MEIDKNDSLQAAEKFLQDEFITREDIECYSDEDLIRWWHNGHIANVGYVPQNVSFN